ELRISWLGLIWGPRIGGPLFCRAFDGPERRGEAGGDHHHDFNGVGPPGLVPYPRQVGHFASIAPPPTFLGHICTQKTGKLVFEIYSGEFLSAVLIAHDEAGGFLLNRQGLSRPILWLVVSPAPEQIKKSHLAPPEFHASGCAERWASPRPSRIKAASDQKR